MAYRGDRQEQAKGSHFSHLLTFDGMNMIEILDGQRKGHTFLYELYMNLKSLLLIEYERKDFNSINIISSDILVSYELNRINNEKINMIDTVDRLLISIKISYLLWFCICKSKTEVDI